MSMTYEQRKARSIEHSTNPRAGDYWHECFAPVALVLAVNAFSVSYLHKTKSVGAGWTWDTSHVEVKTPAEFKRWLSYDKIEGTWAHVEPEWKHFQFFYDEALEAPDASGAGEVPRG